MSGRGGKALTILAVSVLSWYSAVKFWKPIVVDQLKKDGALRTDIEIEVSEDDQPKSWEDLKHSFKSVIHPDKKVEWEKQRNLERNLNLLAKVKEEQDQAKREKENESEN